MTSLSAIATPPVTDDLKIDPDHIGWESTWIADDTTHRDHGMSIVAEVALTESEDVLLIRWRFADENRWRSPEAMNQRTYKQIEEEALNT